MKAEQKGNVVVSGRRGIAFVGFLTKKLTGEIGVSRNAPTWLSPSECSTVINAIQIQAESVSIAGEMLKIEITWAIKG